MYVRMHAVFWQVRVQYLAIRHRWQRGSFAKAAACSWHRSHRSYRYFPLTPSPMPSPFFGRNMRHLPVDHGCATYNEFTFCHLKHIMSLMGYALYFANCIMSTLVLSYVYFLYDVTTQTQQHIRAGSPMERVLRQFLWELKAGDFLSFPMRG